MRITKFFEKTRQSLPRRIDIENEKLRSEIISEFLELLDRAGDGNVVLRSEFPQRRSNRSAESIVLLEQDDAWLRRSCADGFGTSRHLGKPLECLAYDKVKALVKGKVRTGLTIGWRAAPAPIRSGALRSDPGWRRDRPDTDQTRFRLPNKRANRQSPSRMEKSGRLLARPPACRRR
jgi:hypothetical protein